MPYYYYKYVEYSHSSSFLFPSPSQSLLKSIIRRQRKESHGLDRIRKIIWPSNRKISISAYQSRTYDSGFSVRPRNWHKLLHTHTRPMISLGTSYFPADNSPNDNFRNFWRKTLCSKSLQNLTGNTGFRDSHKSSLVRASALRYKVWATPRRRMEWPTPMAMPLPRQLPVSRITRSLRADSRH